MHQPTDTPPDGLVGRRDVLRTALIGTGIAAIAAADLGRPTSAQAATTTTTTSTSTTGAASLDAATLNLLRRTTFGITPDLVADVTKLGASAWLSQQLNPSSISDTACDAIVARFPLHAADPPTVVSKIPSGSQNAMLDLERATIARNIWSKRQLLEVMVEFWNNHFNCTNFDTEVWFSRPWEDANVQRKYALGRFADMLVADSQSPGMGLYLNNFESTGSNPNENYARELLELHTVGVNAGYTHDDIRGAALALTGHTYWSSDNGGTASNYGTWRFIAANHYVGPVTVMGWSNANATAAGGVDVAVSLMNYLAHHPATATHLATKLATRFVSDSPSTSIVTAMANAYLANDTQIVPMLQAMFNHADFAASAGQKFRRPYEDMIATLRVCGVAVNTKSKTIGGIDSIGTYAAGLGQVPMTWPTPDGFPDTADAWVGAGTTLLRWNMHVGVAQHWPLDGLTYPDLYTYLVPSGATTRGQLVDALLARLLPGIAVAPEHRTALMTFLGGDGPVSSNNGETTWLLPIIVGLVLDSPYWSVR